MQKSAFFAALFLLHSASAFADAPVLVTGSVRNAASQAAGVSPGAWITISGANLAAEEAVDGSLPESLAGVTVTINSQTAQLYSVSPSLLRVLAPPDLPTGLVEVAVTTAEGSATVKAIAYTVMPGVFTSGGFAASAGEASGLLVDGAAPISAHPGDAISIYATGLGTAGTNPTVRIGSAAAAVSASAQVWPGVYQVDVTVPSTLANGTYPVVLTQDGVLSQVTALIHVSVEASAGITLQSSTSSAASGSSIAFTAAVSPASSTGTVTFYEGPIPIGTAALSSGSATFTTSFPPGFHAVTATFGSGASQVTSLASVVSISAVENCAALAGIDRIVCLATAFQSTLSSTQLTSLQYNYTLANVQRWSNLPISIVARNGLRFGDLTSAQQSAALALAQAALSDEGFDRLAQVRGADEVISPLNAMFRWGAANYYIAFYGTPSTTAAWMLQVAGHHYALNRTFNSKYTSGSPFFLGTEPVSYTLHGAEYLPQDKQRAAMYALNQTLLSNSSAKLTGTFDDVVMGVGQSGIDSNYPQTYPTTGRGVAVSTLSASQQALIRRAIEAWVGELDPASATELLSDYLSEDALANTYVGYSGSGSMSTVGDYIRVDGPRVWVELVVQSGIAYRNSYHYHSIWRDKTADYGGEFK